MRSLVFTLCCFFSAAMFAQTNVTFQSKTTYTGQYLSNIWGYAAAGKEYALIGAENGMIVTNVTNPAAPVQITQITGAGSEWREIKTYQHYAYIATEGGGGLQIVDLANLPASNLPLVTYTGGGTTPGTLNTIHALQVDVAKGFLYLYGTNLVGGRAMVFDLNANPAAPVYKGYYNPVGYAHDGYVNNDTMYVGHIYAGLVSIVDMTVKTSSNHQIGVTLATIATPLAFSHNTWRAGNTLLTTDEKSNSSLAAYDISNYSDIKLLDQIQSTPGSGSIVHNTYIRNGYAITSWYRDGFTITDVSRPANMVQVGNYDTYPGSGNGFDGAWGVYPFLPSGNILVSNINAQGTTNGEMWVCSPTYQRGCYVEGTVTDAVTGNPVSGAKAELLTTTTTNNTSALGLYKMGQLQSGTYTFKVTKTGYNPFTQAITIANGVLTTVNAPLTPVGGCNYVTHNSENFDLALGIWTDGGTDCARFSSGAPYANSGLYSVRLRSNSTSSLMTTKVQNCANYTEMKISFSYYVQSFDNANEDFWLQVSKDGGTTFTTVADYNYSVEFHNNVRKYATVTIPGPFTANTKFRFRADASATDDRVYIDDVVITGCSTLVANDINNGSDVAESKIAIEPDGADKASGDIFDLKSGPNPASDVFTLRFMANADIPVTYMVSDLAGRVVLQGNYEGTEGQNELSIDVRALAQGTYTVALRTDKGLNVRKMIVR